MKFSSLFLALSLSTSILAENPAALPLWEKGAPGSESRRAETELTEGSNVMNVHNPSITPFIPTAEKSTGIAVIIAPGGGHAKLCLGHEGYELGEWLRDQGIAAFVLKYRLARDKNSKAEYTIQDHAMADMRRAIRTIRSQAKTWNVDPNKIGVLGFSAGGELAAFSAMQSDAGKADSNDPIEKSSSRPDFQALIYPGTSRLFTVEKGMPPLFIACGYDDRTDISEGMAEMYLKYKRAGVKAELHIFANAGHGFGYRANAKKSAARDWTFRFTDWLQDSGFLNK